MRFFNKRFAELYLERTKEYADLPKITLRESKSLTAEAYRKLIKMIEAKAFISHSAGEGYENYETLINRINALIIQYNQLVDSRVASNQPSEDLEAV